MFFKKWKLKKDLNREISQFLSEFMVLLGYKLKTMEEEYQYGLDACDKLLNSIKV
jgi:hypothetical protein